MNDPKTNDAISRSAVLTVGNVRKVTEYDEAGYDMTYDAVPVEAIEALPALDVAPVVRCKDCRWYDSAFYACSKCGVCVNRDFFCADGERE